MAIARPTALACWIGLALLLGSPWSARGTDGEPYQDVLAEFPAQFERLKQFYTNYASDGTLLYEKYDAAAAAYRPLKTVAGALKVRDDALFRLAWTRGDTEYLLLASPDQFYFFETPQPDQKRFIRAHGKSYRPNGFPQEYYFRFGACEAGNVLAALRHRNPEMNLRIQRVTESHEAGEALVTVETSAAAAGAPNREIITYYRNRCWALKDYFSWQSFDADEQYVWQRRHVDYEGERDGIPIMKRLVHETGTAPYGANDVDRQVVYQTSSETGALRYTLSIDHFEPGPPALAEFDPQPLLKELGGLGQAVPPARSSWFLALNVLLLLAVALLLLRRKRSS